MPYNNPRNPDQPPQNQPPQNQPGIGARDVAGLGQAGLAGFWQGLTGKNQTFEQWMMEKRRKQRGFPSKNPNWLQRLFRFK